MNFVENQLVTNILKNEEVNFLKKVSYIDVFNYIDVPLALNKTAHLHLL